MRHYLDGTGVEEPEGFSGIYLEKVRDSRFGGILKKGIGRVRGIGEVMFTEPMACNILSRAFARAKTDAAVTYKVVDEDGTVIVESDINFANYRRKRAGWSITLRDVGAVETLTLQADRVATISPTTTKIIKPILLATSATHDIDGRNNVFQWKVPSVAASLTHFLPWLANVAESNVTGSPQSVTSFTEGSPVWINTTNASKTVQVVGRVSVKHRAGSSISGVFRVVSEGRILETPFTVGTALETKTYVLNQVIQVPVNGDIRISAYFASTRNDFYFEYLADSYLSINQDADVPETQVRCTPISTAMQKCAAEIDAGLIVSFQGVGSELITTGQLLRGVSTGKIRTSFGALFDDLNRLKNIIATRSTTNGIIIKPKTDFLNSLGDGLIISDVQDFEFSASPTLTSRIIVGYSRWQSYTPTGSEEIYGNEEFSTGLTKIDNLLNLLCSNLCASEKLIEYVRRIQFQTGGAKAEKDSGEDERIFVIEGAPTPKQIISAWSSFWSASAETVRKTTGSPSTLAYTVGAEKIFFTGEVCSLQAALSGKEWNRLDDVVTFYDDNGKKVRLYVLSATYHPGAAGSNLDSNVIVEGLVMVN